uniref:cystathionine gamma-lyase n=1 Tax=Parastrongyloides trichosuri TaxID=131310 RepID=A0A0N4ZJZ5_PARTI
MSSDNIQTQVIHAGQESDKWYMNPVIPPMVLSTTYEQVKPNVNVGHDYIRAGNPSRDIIQKCLATIENCKYSCVYSSGMTASMAIINYLKAGEHIITSKDIYGGTKDYLHQFASINHAIEVSSIDMTDVNNVSKELIPNTKMVWLETPSNPHLVVIDINAVVTLVKNYNPDIIVVVDSTFLTPYFQKPLALGADVVVHSITKYLNGHSDVMMGCCNTNNETIYRHLHLMQTLLGLVPSPFDCYLANRGLKTLHVRMDRHYQNGLAVAKFLESNPRVDRVLYPALPSHPQHDIHMKQTTGMSGMVSFYIKGDLNTTYNFLQNLKLIKRATSLGGYESLAEVSSLKKSDANPEKDCGKIESNDYLIRMSVGLEDVNDIIDDIDQALKIATFFFLTCLGFVYGLGGPWKFPILAFENGGVAFFVAYIIGYIFIAFPILNFEVNLGQFSRSSVGTVFGKLMPAAQGLGWCMAINSFLFIISYNFHISLILNFIVSAIFMPTGSIISCKNVWNSDGCTSLYDDKECFDYYNKKLDMTINVSIFYNNNCYHGYDYKTLDDNRTLYFRTHQIEKVNAVEEFFNDRLLNISSKVDDFGSFNWIVFLSMISNWIIVFLIAINGIKTIQRVSAVALTFASIFIILLLLFVLSLKGASTEVYKFFTQPDFSYLLRLETWLEVGSFIFFQFGLGVYLLMGSYLNGSQNVYKSIIKIGIHDVTANIVTTSFVMGIYGFLSHYTKLSIKDMMNTEVKLIFVSIPEAALMMPIGTIFLTIILLIIYLLGLLAISCCYEVLISTCSECFMVLKNNMLKFRVFSILFFMTSNFIFSFSNGFYILTILNEYVATFNVFIIVIIEFLIIVVYYKMKTFIEDIRSMIGSPSSKFQSIFSQEGLINKYLWMFVTPTITFVIFIVTFFNMTTSNLSVYIKNNEYIFPPIVTKFGWFISLSPLMAIPIFLVYNIWRYKKYHKPLHKLLKPTSKWPKRNNTPMTDFLVRNTTITEDTEDIFSICTKSL